ncbi:IS3 family transposase [Deinococcus peraridilitoris]|uniref:Transposase n=1 Tax=Deinococcus peraridilitoris (strain DSM 19664 / LMG 22246 / CIP 109416 / KR-200) TaxID=937777 RepID=L0A9A9_DEIPD|nr:IS3 family transposase [Deinococcus peraridilitoris]AFZ69620.1 transposase [Deinococcus peraridilitoris DSM 19664]
MTNRKVYTAEFKQEAVRLAETTGNVSGTARDLGISDSVLRKWIKAAQQQGQRAFPGQGRQLLTPEQEEIKRLRAENEILRQEREILKKAAAFFAKESR